MTNVKLGKHPHFLRLCWVLVTIIIVGWESQALYAQDSITPSPSLDSSSRSAASNPLWKYGSFPYPMGRGTFQTASLDSVDSVDGGTASIQLSSSLQGDNAIFGMDNGQLLCDQENCPVTLHADKGEPIVISEHSPKSHSTYTIDLPYSTMLQYAERSKLLSIKVYFYQGGAHIFEFYLHGFDVSKMKQ